MVTLNSKSIEERVHNIEKSWTELKKSRPSPFVQNHVLEKLGVLEATLVERVDEWKAERETLKLEQKFHLIKNEESIKNFEERLAQVSSKSIQSNISIGEARKPDTVEELSCPVINVPGENDCQAQETESSPSDSFPPFDVGRSEWIPFEILESCSDF